MKKQMACAFALSCVGGTAVAGYGFEPIAALAPQAVAAQALAVGDVSGDGRDDVVVLAGGSHPYFARKVVVYAQADTGFEAPRAYDAGATDPYGSANALGLADLDADGDLDIVVSRGGFPVGTVAVLRNDGTGFPTTLFPVAEPLVQMTFEDVDRDGHLDIVGRGSYWSGATILYGDGGGGFREQVELPLVSEGMPFHLVDMDGDDRRDLVYMESGKVWMRRHDGAGYAATARALLALPRQGYGTQVAVADFDGDHRADIAASTYRWPGNALVVFPQSPGGTFRSKRPVSGVGEVGVLRPVDLDDDGRTDLLTLDQWYGSGLGVLLAQGTRFEAVDAFDVGAAHELAVGDLNADGRKDVVVLGDGEVGYLLGRGAAMEGDLSVHLGLNAGAAAVRIQNRSSELATSPYQFDLRIDVRRGDITIAQMPSDCTSWDWDGDLYVNCQMPALAPGAHRDVAISFALSTAAANTLRARAQATPQGHDLNVANNRAARTIRVSAAGD